MPVDPRRAAAEAASWDSYVDDLDEALQGSAGWEREKLRLQLEDAQAGRANAYKIAQLSASTQRYGIDKNFDAEMKRLRENQRQFDLNHALEKEKFAEVKRQFGLEFGLKYADAATSYLSSPDRFAQGIDFRRMADRALTGAYGGGETPSGPEPYGTGVTFTPKTEADFAVLAGYGTRPGASAGWAPGAGAAPAPPAQPTPSGGIPDTAPPGGGALYSTQPVDEPGPPATRGPQDGGAPGPPDPRTKVLKTMIDALPPSTGSGLDENDNAVLRAAEALMSTNLRPGTLQGMRPDQRAIFGSFVRRSGRSLNDFLADYDAYQPHQRSVRSA